MPLPPGHACAVSMNPHSEKRGKLPTGVPLPDFDDRLEDVSMNPHSEKRGKPEWTIDLITERDIDGVSMNPHSEKRGKVC